MKTKMMSLGLGALWFAQACMAQTPDTSVAPWKIAYLPDSLKAPALAGFLGDPLLGSFHAGRNSPLMVWHTDGRLLVSNQPDLVDGLKMIQMWDVTSEKSGRARNLGQLNVGGTWAISGQSEWLCAQAFRQTEERSFYDQDEFRAISCFRLTDGQRVWKQPLEKDERLLEMCFAKDDTKILVGTGKKSFYTLRLLDVKTGAEESRVVLPDLFDNSHKPSLVSYGSQFLLLWTPRSQKSVLALVKGSPLSLDPAPFEGLELATYEHLQASPDERYLACYGREHHAIFELKSGVWGVHQWEDDPHYEAMTQGFLNTMVFSPDSRFLLSSSRNFSVVYDLSAHKQVKKWDVGHESLLFSPDGSSVMAMEPSGIARYDTRDWTYSQPLDNQHGSPVREIEFLDDGKTLISHDQNEFILWDVPSRKPRAVLQDPRRNGQIHQYTLANGKKEIIAGNGQDYLRWTLPDLQKPVPPKPEVIVGKLAFQGLESDNDQYYMNIFGNETGTRFMTIAPGKVQLRDLSAPGLVKTFTLPRTDDTVFSFHAAFLNDTKAVLYAGGKTLVHLDLVSGESTLVPISGGSGSPGPWLPDKRSFVMLNSHEVTLVEGETGSQIPLLVGSARTVDFQTILNAGFGMAMTRDRKLAVTSKKIGDGMRSLLQFWDLPSGKILAQQELHQLWVDGLAFSPDGKTLAIGHRNTAISLWDVRKILAGAPPSVKSAEAPTVPRKKAEVISVMELPKQPLNDHQGHAWSFHADGSCSVESLLPGFASLKVNGKPFQSNMVRYKKVENNELFQSPTSIVHDGGIEGGEIAISRYLGYNRMMGDTSVQAIDSVTNLTGVLQDLEISFEVRFPEDSQGLLGSLSGRLPISADGLFSLQPKEHWIAAAGSGKKGEALACVRVNTWSNPQIPKLSWSAGTQTVKLSYRVSLPPGETRWMVHSVVLKERPEEGYPDKLVFPYVSDVGHYVMPGNQTQGINFSRPSPIDRGRWGVDNQDVFAPGRDEEYKPETDALGFSWERQADLGRIGGLGATSLYQIWFDQRPSAMSSNLYFLYPYQRHEQISPPVITRYENSLDVGVVRQDHTTDSGATIWYDRYFNKTNAPKTLRVSYVTTFRSPVLEVWDQAGNKHSVADFKGPATAVIGASAFVLKGEEQPATLLVFYKEGAPVVPTIRWMGSQAVVLDYEFEIQANSKVSLLLGACQRPLKAFGGVQGAFADWVPLSRPPAPQPWFYGFVDTSSQDGVPVMNYIVAPK